jgi:hypothetical protein
MYLEVIKKQPNAALRSSMVLVVGMFCLKPTADLKACMVEYSVETGLLMPRSQTRPMTI